MINQRFTIEKLVTTENHPGIDFSVVSIAPQQGLDFPTALTIPHQSSVRIEPFTINTDGKGSFVVDPTDAEEKPHTIQRRRQTFAHSLFETARLGLSESSDVLPLDNGHYQVDGWIEYGSSEVPYVHREDPSWHTSCGVLTITHTWGTGHTLEVLSSAAQSSIPAAIENMATMADGRLLDVGQGDAVTLDYLRSWLNAKPTVENGKSLSLPNNKIVVVGGHIWRTAYYEQFRLGRVNHQSATIYARRLQPQQNTEQEIEEK